MIDVAKVIDESIYDLDLTVRTCSALKRMEVHTLRDLLKHKLNDVLRLTGVGNKVKNELDEFVQSIGMRFEMTDKEIDKVLKVIGPTEIEHRKEVVEVAEKLLGTEFFTKMYIGYMEACARENKQNIMPAMEYVFMLAEGFVTNKESYLKGDLEL